MYIYVLLGAMVPILEPLNKDMAMLRTQCFDLSSFGYRVYILEYFWFVLCSEVCPLSECPLLEVPLCT